MDKLTLSPKIKSKAYIESLNTYNFPTLLHLTQALFESYSKGSEDLENIYLLLDELGYNNLKDIKEKDYDRIEMLIQIKTHKWSLLQDSEFLTYGLLAAVSNQDVYVYIDEQLVTEINKPLKLGPASLISFICKQKINDITFTTF